MSLSELKRLQDVLLSAPETRADLTRDMAAANDTAGLAEALKRHGYSISKDELEALSLPGELSSHELEAVAGGSTGNSMSEMFARVLKVKKQL